ncbi:hypothetical protein [Enterococcus faecalis]|uniref:hypothetical protein n=1 Tax=Enterococcus faecalis TaxID=1351 RepID=UPI002430DCBC|nr:hypothetical protein [Enterococcus faecalis]
MMNFSVFCILLGGLGLIVGAVLFLTQLLLKYDKKKSKQILLFSTIFVVLGIIIGVAAPSNEKSEKASSTSDSSSLLSNESSTTQTTLEMDQTLSSSTSQKIKEVNISEYTSDISYDDLARNPENNKGKKLTLSGTIIQVIEGTDYSQYRLAMDDDYDRIVFIEISKSLLSSRILNNDIVTIYGKSYGTIDYESTLSGNITVPAIAVDKFEITGQAE